jgi:hypothetical protein
LAGVFHVKHTQKLGATRRSWKKTGLQRNEVRLADLERILALNATAGPSVNGF